MTRQSEGCRGRGAEGLSPRVPTQRFFLFLLPLISLPCVSRQQPSDLPVSNDDLTWRHVSQTPTTLISIFFFLSPGRNRILFLSIRFLLLCQLWANLMEEGGAARCLLPRPPRSFIKQLGRGTKMHSRTRKAKNKCRFFFFSSIFFNNLSPLADNGSLISNREGSRSRHASYLPKDISCVPNHILLLVSLNLVHLNSAHYLWN